MQVFFNLVTNVPHKRRPGIKSSCFVACCRMIMSSKLHVHCSHCTLFRICRAGII